MKKSKSARSKATPILASKDQDVLSLLSTLVEKLTSFESKIDLVLGWVNSQSTIKPASLPPRPFIQAERPVRREDRRDSRPMYKAVCADCHSYCQIPFKPSGGRPVYCQECFRARKNNNLRNLQPAEKPKELVPIYTQLPQKPKASERLKSAKRKPIARKKAKRK